MANAERISLRAAYKIKKLLIRYTVEILRPKINPWFSKKIFHKI